MIPGGFTRVAKHTATFPRNQSMQTSRPSSFLKEAVWCLNSRGESLVSK